MIQFPLISCQRDVEDHHAAEELGR